MKKMVTGIVIGALVGGLVGSISNSDMYHLKKMIVRKGKQIAKIF